jgi:hypothetical protein
MSKIIIADLSIDELLHVNDNEQKMINGGGGVGGGGTGGSGLSNKGTPDKLFPVITRDFSLDQ